jgi:hypothetical protein
MDELLKIVQRFGDVLKQIVGTIDRRGLKKHFLKLIAGDDASFLKQRLPIRENREALAAK